MVIKSYPPSSLIGGNFWKNSRNIKRYSCWIESGLTVGLYQINLIFNTMPKPLTALGSQVH